MIRRDISLTGWQVVWAMASVTLGMWLGILRLFLWARS
jgi:hypothetical protein